MGSVVRSYPFLCISNIWSAMEIHHREIKSNILKWNLPLYLRAYGAISTCLCRILTRQSIVYTTMYWLNIFWYLAWKFANCHSFFCATNDHITIAIEKNTTFRLIFTPAPSTSWAKTLVLDATLSYWSCWGTSFLWSSSSGATLRLWSSSRGQTKRLRTWSTLTLWTC